MPASAAWLTPTQAAEHLGVSAATVLRAARTGRLTAYKVGLGRKLWRFKTQDLDMWLTEDTVPALHVVAPRSKGSAA